MEQKEKRKKVVTKKARTEDVKGQSYSREMVRAAQLTFLFLW